MTLALHEPKETSLAQVNTDSNPIGAMLQTIIANGITADTAATMEKMTDLYLKVEAENARKAFAQAKAQLQAELPRVIARRIIPNNDGSARSTFAAYEDIMAAIQPALVKHGFSVSFTFRYDTSGKAERLCAICQLAHIEGHSETNEFAVRVSEPPKASGAQGDGATHTYAKRYALCAALNIAIDKDSDARNEGDYITPEEATELEALANRFGADVDRLLKFAQADSFREIRSEKLKLIHDMLEQKYGRAKKASPQTVSETLTMFQDFYAEQACATGLDPDEVSRLFFSLKSKGTLTNEGVRLSIVNAINAGTWDFKAGKVK